MQIVYWHICGDSDPVSPAVYKYSLQNPPFRLSGTAFSSVRTSEHGNEGVPVQNITEKSEMSVSLGEVNNQIPPTLFKKNFLY